MTPGAFNPGDYDAPMQEKQPDSPAMQMARSQEITFGELRERIFASRAEAAADVKALSAALATARERLAMLEAAAKQANLPGPAGINRIDDADDDAEADVRKTAF